MMRRVRLQYDKRGCADFSPAHHVGRIGTLRLIIISAVSTMLLAAVPAAAALADDFRTCAQAPGDAAITACTRAIASGRYRGKELARLHYNRGVEYDNKGELDRAIDDYTEAIRLDPRDADYFAARGIAWRAKGELDRAIADYTEAIRLDPKFARAFNNRGNLWRDKGEIDRAIA